MKKVAVSLFAVLGVAAAIWVVFGPAIVRWWRTPPEPPPAPPREVEVAGLTPPDFSTVDPDQTAEVAAARIVAASPAAWRTDSRLATLGGAPPLELVEAIEFDVGMYFSGSREKRLEWFERNGAHDPALASGDPERIERFWKLWDIRTEGVRNAIIQPQDIRYRLRFLNGEGPYPAPEDEINRGMAYTNERFSDLPDLPPVPSERQAGKLTMVEALVPYLFINKNTGDTEQCYLGLWYVRKQGESRWRLLRTHHYSFTFPSQNIFPWP